jgi:hypothetical protein
MSSFTALRCFYQQMKPIAAEAGVPVEAALELVFKADELRAGESAEKREQQDLWKEKKPLVEAFYKANSTAWIDPDDVVEHVGLPKTRGNKTRVYRELRQLGWSRDAGKMAAD